jgi:hypothetical protein
MDSLHPTLAMALAPLAPPPATGDAQRDHYVALLKRHDWSHEHADDMRSFARGRAELSELRDLQRALDPDFVLWNRHGHPWCRNGVPYPPFPPTAATND